MATNIDTRPRQAALVWFRRDLRDFDHAALAAALDAASPVHCAFVFDTEILYGLEARDARVAFIWESVGELATALESRGGGLHVLHGRAREEIPRLARSLGVAAVYANRDYEPAAIERDEQVADALDQDGIAMHTFKDQVLFESHEVTTTQGAMYSVFTPYKRAWLRKLAPQVVQPREPREAGALASANRAIPPLEAMGFEPCNLPVAAGMSGGARAWGSFRPRLGDYARLRDFPAVQGTSGLSVHLRFGTVSIRELARAAMRSDSAGAQAWLSELAWRDFYFAILATRPDVVDGAFHPRFNALRWEDDERAWQAWRTGRTGYPLVDAAMRELGARGTMHNRLRMVSASFLVKDLGIDWRRGERHFASRLIDYDLAANNGGWQWCASTGCDAQPWFRIFNPVTQSRRFDPQGDYIRRWVPELARVSGRDVHAPWEMPPLVQQEAGCVIGRDYPAPIVSHDEARRRTLARYAAISR